MSERGKIETPGEIEPFFDFDNSHARLPPRFYQRIAPTPPRSAELIKLNHSLATELGLDAARLASSAGSRFLSGAQIPEGADPIAVPYAGHQFGSFVPSLGDGRAITLGELIDRGGRRFDLQLKGAGRTAFSRQGDGRAPLGAVIREYIVSEAMNALGIPTTRALAALTSGEALMRDKIEPGGILVRVASSHIRIGTFQYFSARGDTEAIKILIDYTIARHYPELIGAPDRALGLLDRVIETQASLVARWIGVGFVHGVMNTDNTALSGETIDYGPCAFLDEYDPNKTFSSIDRAGRYAFGAQGAVAGWNLARFAETILNEIDSEPQTALERARDRIENFSAIFKRRLDEVWRAKFGLSATFGDDAELIAEALEIMRAEKADYTKTFRELSHIVDQNSNGADAPQLSSRLSSGRFPAWKSKWLTRLQRESRARRVIADSMRAVNPARIARNHQIDRAIRIAVEKSEYSVIDEMSQALSDPYSDHARFEEYARAPRAEEKITRTFCGT